MSRIAARNINKTYKYYKSEISRFLSWFGFNSTPSESYEVLKDISFFVEPGEALGVVGENGAGKSTLLKVLTGIVKPTSGEVQVNGRVAAILELGMGFNMDFTGRQNAKNALGMMGFSPSEIDRVLPEVEDFAEIGEYFDQSARMYSSGMLARVAFAVAIAFTPDVLIVDEALSVGDVYFQGKCFQKMLDIKNSGTSILLVSHDMQSVCSFCDRALLLKKGTVAAYGTPKDIAQKYERMVNSYSNRDVEIEPLNTARQVETDTVKAKLIKAEILGKDGENKKNFVSEEGVSLQFSYQILEDLNDAHFGIRITDRLGNSAFETNTYCMREQGKQLKKGDIAEVSFDFDINIISGAYTVDVAIANEGHSDTFFREYISMDNNVLIIDVVPNKDSIIYHGYCNLKPKVTVRSV